MCYQMVTDTRTDSACTSPTLPGVCQGYPFRLESRQIGFDVEICHLDFAAVDDVNDVLYCYRSLWKYELLYIIRIEKA